MSQDATSRLTALVALCEGDPAAMPAVRAEGDRLAADVSGALGLRWCVTVIRAVMADPPDGDAVRELYGALVDQYREDPERLAILRPLGDEIRKREADGTLPSAMVARSDRRPRR